MIINPSFVPNLGNSGDSAAKYIKKKYKNINQEELIDIKTIFIKAALFTILDNM